MALEKALELFFFPFQFFFKKPVRLTLNNDEVFYFGKRAF